MRQSTVAAASIPFTETDWITERSITATQIKQLRQTPGLPESIRLACGRALNELGLGSYYVREARRTCAAAVNKAKREASK